jgi:catechol 2,3-dioxygenase-like lactoylglutathione lyase family enzyme
VILHHAGICVADIDKALRFYREGAPIADIDNRDVDVAALLLHEASRFIKVFRARQRVVVGCDVLTHIHGDDVGTFSGQ